MRRTLIIAAYYLAVGLVLAVVIAPLFIMLRTSFTTGDGFYQARWWPSPSTLSNYAHLLSGPFVQAIKNSILMCAAVSIVSVLMALLAGYPLARRRFGGRNAVRLGVLAIAMFPPVALLPGLLELIRSLGIYNSLAALILSNLIYTLPLSLWLVMTAIKDVPFEIEEAARIDGAGTFRILFQLILPLIAPVAATAALLSFIAAWNEFLFGLTFTLTPSAKPVSVALAQISGATRQEVPFGAIAGGAVIVTLPLIALMVLFQGRIRAGLTEGSVK